MKSLEPAVLPVNLPKGLRDDAIYMNDVYQVNVRKVEVPGWGLCLHLSIKRLDRQPVTDWRDKQWIKNQIAGPEAEAVELYPAESRLVDTANQYHLFCIGQGFRFPFGFESRMVSQTEMEMAPGKAPVQRPFAEHVIDDPLPSREELALIVAGFKQLELTDEEKEKVVSSVQGLGGFMAEQAIASSLLVDTKKKVTLDHERLWHRKRKMVGDTPGLEF